MTFPAALPKAFRLLLLVVLFAIVPPLVPKAIGAPAASAVAAETMRSQQTTTPERSHSRRLSGITKMASRPLGRAMRLGGTAISCVHRPMLRGLLMLALVAGCGVSVPDQASTEAMRAQTPRVEAPKAIKRTPRPVETLPPPPAAEQTRPAAVAADTDTTAYYRKATTSSVFPISAHHMDAGQLAVGLCVAVTDPNRPGVSQPALITNEHLVCDPRTHRPYTEIQGGFPGEHAGELSWCPLEVVKRSVETDFALLGFAGQQAETPAYRDKADVYRQTLARMEPLPFVSGVRLGDQVAQLAFPQQQVTLQIANVVRQNAYRLEIDRALKHDGAGYLAIDPAAETNPSAYRSHGGPLIIASGERRGVAGLVSWYVPGDHRAQTSDAQSYPRALSARVLSGLTRRAVAEAAAVSNEPSERQAPDIDLAHADWGVRMKGPTGHEKVPDFGQARGRRLLQSWADGRFRDSAFIRDTDGIYVTGITLTHPDGTTDSFDSSVGGLRAAAALTVPGTDIVTVHQRAFGNIGPVKEIDLGTKRTRRVWAERMLQGLGLHVVSQVVLPKPMETLTDQAKHQNGVSLTEPYSDLYRVLLVTKIDVAEERRHVTGEPYTWVPPATTLGLKQGDRVVAARFGGRLSISGKLGQLPTVRASSPAPLQYIWSAERLLEPTIEDAKTLTSLIVLRDNKAIDLAIPDQGETLSLEILRNWDPVDWNVFDPIWDFTEQPATLEPRIH